MFEYTSWEVVWAGSFVRVESVKDASSPSGTGQNKVCLRKCSGVRVRWEFWRGGETCGRNAFFLEGLSEKICFGLWVVDPSAILIFQRRDA